VNKLNTFAKQIIEYAPSAFLPAVTSFLAIFFFTNILRPDQYGTYNIAFNLAVLFSSLTTQWLTQGINRYLPAENADEGTAHIQQASTVSLLRIGAGLTLLSIGISLIIMPALPSHTHSILLATLSFLITNSLFTPLTTLFQAQLRPRRYTLYRSLFTTMQLCLALFLVTRVYRDPSAIMWANTVVQAILIVWMWPDAKLPAPDRFAKLSARQLNVVIRRLFVYGFPMTGWLVASSLLNVGDRYLLQMLRGSAEVGIYAVNYAPMSQGVTLLGMPILLAGHPWLMKVWGQKNYHETARLLGSIIEKLVLVGILVTGIAWLYSGDIAGVLLGPQFRRGHNIMPIIAAGAMLWQIANYIHKPLEFANDSKMLCTYSLIALTINVVLNLWLIPTYGFVAAAWNTLIAYGSYVLMAGTAAFRILPCKLDSRRLILTLLSLILAFAAIGQIRGFLEYHVSHSMGFVVAILLTLLLMGVFIYRSVKVPIRNLIKSPLLISTRKEI